ncbi:hypothetical protein BU26DRAFT_570313 [Trematosphaeria pertusa]|uniref:Uncharacterized protein n=1 Tax=Trematosphaeria pertusa TaxID=390896 RepID=A0A6A6HXE8_9PLEO|nr:uncharacterized protein BU26DRAFT_570313 [Trematosphaeria pertusa]KAF2242885.1 hypothetical protein BU26DRAFT_570313 [Trematosphaeria pertusa]
MDPNRLDIAREVGERALTSDSGSDSEVEDGISNKRTTPREYYGLSRIPSRSLFHEHRIRAYLNSIEILAFPDSCSGLNIISESFLRRHSLSLNTNIDYSARLPNGKLVKSLGSLNLTFRFNRQHKGYRLPFTVLQNCVHDVVLGSDFLRQTETLTKYLGRIEWFRRPPAGSIPRVCFVNNPQQVVLGSINGQLVSASPDTGSDVNLISKLCATVLGLKIDTVSDRITTLEFIDGSTVPTFGMVSGVHWRFGADNDAQSPPSLDKRTKVQEWDFGTNASPGDTYLCDFYVLEHLMFPVILSSDLLLGSNAFAACGRNFHLTSVLGKRRREDVDVCFIRAKKPRPSWREVVLGRRASYTPSSVTPAQAWENELRRRGDEADRIADLPPHERVAAQEAENQRIEQWNAGQGRATPRQNPPPPSQNVPSAFQSQP